MVLRSLTLLFVMTSLAACSTGVSASDEQPSTQEDLVGVDAVVSFPAAGAPSTDKPLVAGGSVKITYPAERLLAAHPECITNGGQGGSPLGEVQMGLRFNGDSGRTYYFPDVAVSTTSSVGPRIQNEVPIPSDVRKVDLWFSCGANAFHDQAYDSRNGDNYPFEVSAPALANEVQTRRTTIGGSIDLRSHSGAQVDQGPHFFRPYTFTLTYDDLAGFAGSDYQEIHAWVGVTTHVAHHGGWSSPSTTASRTVTLTRQAPRKFTGSFTLQLGGELGDSQENIDDIAVAISNDQGGWDSDSARNYHFR